MPITFLNRVRGGGGTRAFDADVLAWESAAVANGGSPTLAYRIALDQFVYSEKASGAWALTDDYWVLWAPDAGCALTSLKQRRLATAVNAPTFTSDRGYAFDGTTQYINTDFIPSTHAVAMTGTDLHFDVYERTNVGSAAIHGVFQAAATRALTLTPRSAANNITGSANGAGATSGGLITDGLGLAAIYQGGGGVGVVKNGVLLTTATPTLGAILPNFSMYLGAYNSSGTAAGFRAASLGFASAGAALSEAQHLARYNAVQTFATAVGAQV